MQSSSENNIYDKVAKKIRKNLNNINNLLSNCSIESKFATEETQKKFENVFNINTDNVIINEASDQYYDLEKVSRIFENLERTKSVDGTRKIKSRSESLVSLNSANTDPDDNQDILSELINQLKEMRETLEEIENSKIKTYDYEKVKSSETIQNNKFIEQVFSLQKLARELTNIASTDALKKEEFSFSVIDDKLIARLKQLNKSLENLNKLEQNKNPITNVEKKGNIMFETSSIINSVLEAIENNSL